MDLALSKGFLARTLGGLVLLGGLASHAQAGTFGVCVLPGVFTALGTSSADYSTAVVTAGCIPGFSSSLQPSAILNPTSLGAGLTTATLNLSQPMTSGGTAVAIATASIDQGAIHLYGDSQGTPIGCGGTCQTTGGSAFPEALFDDTLHFIITDTATSAIGTFQAHLDGVIGLESDFEGSFGNYSVSESFLFGGGSGCWGSQTGLTPGPCGSQNFGWLTSSFSNQTASGFDFTGTFTITNGMSSLFLAGLSETCSGGALCDFSNTASFSMILPSDVTWTSDSGVLFSQQQTAPTPEPGTFGMAGVVLTAVGILRRRIRRNAGKQALR